MTADLSPSYRQAVIEMLREALSQGRSVTFTVRGDSMAPTLGDGDRVRIVPVDVSKLQPGELVSYVDAAGQVITHRVVRLEEIAVITKGDNRDQVDPSVAFDQVLGKATADLAGQN